MGWSRCVRRSFQAAVRSVSRSRMPFGRARTDVGDPLGWMSQGHGGFAKSPRLNISRRKIQRASSCDPAELAR